MQNSQLKFLITCFLIFFSVISNAQTIRLTSSPQYVRVGDLDVTGNKITVEALVKFTGGVNIVSKHTGPPNVNYLMRIGTFEITTTNQFYLMSNPYAGSMQTNTWYHVAGTYDGSFVRYYVNGCLIVQLAATGNIITNNLITGIGNISSAPNGEQFYGEIDELRIWNVARTAAQLSANMFDLPNPTTQTGLLGYWKFDGNLTNLQGNTTYNGTWVGTPDYGTQPLSSVIPTFGIQSVSPINATCYDAANGSIAVTASGTNVNYSIDGTNWGTSNTFSNLDAGNYTVYARTQEGCVQSQASVVISEPAQVTANASNTGPYCPGASISLQGSSSTSGVTYAWTGPGGFTSSLQNPTNATAAGVYQLITSLNGCSSPAASTTVVLNSVPTASATNTGPYCAGDAISLQGASTTAGVTYAWTGPAGFTSSVQNPTNATSAGSYQLITSLNGCSSSAVTTTVVMNPTPTASASNSGPFCAGTAISLQGASTTSGVSYIWSGPNGFSSTLQNPTNATAAGVYQLITSLNGCFSSVASTTVVLNPIPTASASNSGPYCAGDAISLQGASTTAGVTYAWTGPAGFTSSVQNPTNATSAGIYQLITSLNGCSSTIASTTVIVNPTPTVNASNTGAYCVGDPISLQANSSTAGANFVWSGPNGFSSTVQNPLNASEAGAYQVIAIANGCSSLPASTTVIVNPIPTANASNSGPFCQGSQGTLVGQATPATNAIYNWTGPNGFTSSQQNPNVTLGGTYSLLVTVNGCSSASSSTTLVFSPTFSVTASNSGPYYPGESVVLFSSANIPGTYTYLWESDGVSVSTQANPTFPALNQNGEYIVTYTDATGCSATDTTLVLYTLLPEVSVPNVFTPNNDGSNDLFFFDLKGIANVQCQIFNRWGNLIYELNGVNPVWNGKTKNNELVSTGVYFYKLEAIDLLGKKMLKQGNIHILY